MADERFQAGDVVVLNGHRLTVTSVDEVEGIFVHGQPDGSVSCLPATWLPDPEPRAEPSWEPGDVVRDAEGRVYQRTECGWPWQAMCHDVGENVLVRPLTRLVPEGASDTTPQSGDPWDTFGTKRGVVIAEPEAPPLTPGMTVVHPHFGLGVVVEGINGSGCWVQDFVGQSPFPAARRAQPFSALRPVTLVEKPGREAGIETIRQHVVAGRESGMSTLRNTELIYDALFGESS